MEAPATTEGAAASVRESSLSISGGTGDQDAFGAAFTSCAPVPAPPADHAEGAAADLAPELVSCALATVAESASVDLASPCATRPSPLQLDAKEVPVPAELLAGHQIRPVVSAQRSVSPIRGARIMEQAPNVERGRSQRQSSQARRHDSEQHSRDRQQNEGMGPFGPSPHYQRRHMEARVSIAESRREAVPERGDNPLSAADQDKATREAIDQLLSNPESSQSAMFIHHVIVVGILVSTASCVVETLPTMRENPIFFPLEMCITALFTIEFALRLYASNNMIGFFSSPYNLIDFTAIFPGYIELVGVMIAASQDDGSRDRAYRVAGSTKTLRVIRLIRIVRVMKFARHSRALGSLFKMFSKVTVNSLVVVVMLMGFATVLSASLIYLFESEHCQDTGLDCTGDSAFESIPRSFWWAIATLTTVGYGDMVPHTVPGKIIGGCTSVLGIVIVAVSVSLVTLNIKEVYSSEKHRALVEKEIKRRGSGRFHGTGVAAEEQEQLIALLREFERKSDGLLTKLHRDYSMSEMEGDAVFDALHSHKDSFTNDVRRFMTNVLGIEFDGFHTDAFSSQESVLQPNAPP